MTKLAIAPKTGYTSEAKQDYREKVWASMAEYYRPGTWAVCMPAGGVEEIETMLSFGVREEDIYAVDSSAAVIATSKWRKKYPKVRFQAKQLELCRIKGTFKGRQRSANKDAKAVSVANFDLCCNLDGEGFEWVSSFLKRNWCLETCAVAFNIVKARETAGFKWLADALFRRLPDPGGDGGECLRAQLFAALLKEQLNSSGQYTGTSFLASGTYREHRTPMSWAVLEVAFDRKHSVVAPGVDEYANKILQYF